MRASISTIGLLILLSALFALAAPDTIAAPPLYTITDLGTLGGPFSNASGLNDKAEVVGQSSSSPTAGFDAFSWLNGIMTDIPPLAGGTPSLSYANGISDGGLVVGVSNQRAFLYDTGSLTITDLGALTGFTVSAATGINASGQVVGGFFDPNTNYHAFLYSGGQITDLSGTIGGSYSYANGINNAGQIVGTYVNGGSTHAFSYTSGLSVDLGTLYGGTSEALGVNRFGLVVGDSDNHAFLDESGQLHDLGTLPGDTTSAATSINAAGQIVGRSLPSQAVSKAVTWIGGKIYDLNTLIAPGSGWQLTSANAINENGQIVGSGTINGVNHGFLLTPVGEAVAYQINAAHTGSVALPNFTTPLTKQWAVDLGEPPSYPLIAGGRVFAIAGGYANLGATVSLTLTALDAATGNTLWGPINLLNGYPWAADTYDNGTVFVVNNAGRVSAFDATTGTSLWSSQIPNHASCSAPPTARNGVVYVCGTGSGGTVCAYREADGTLLWQAPTSTGDHSSPAVTDTGVYVSFTGPQLYDFDPLTGSQLWHDTSGLTGGGGTTPVYYGGSLYARGNFSGLPQTALVSGLVLDGAMGTQLRTFDPGSYAGPAPAFDNGRGFFQVGGILAAEDSGTGNVLWTAAQENTPYCTAPVVINGTVYEGTLDGSLYALDPASGAVVWNTTLGAALNTPDEWDVSQPLSGLGAGDGLLVVPAGHLLVAYASVPLNPVPMITAVSPSSASVGTTFTLTVTGTGFVPGTNPQDTLYGHSSAIRWNGTIIDTTYVSPTQLTAQAYSYLDATAGTASVTVVTPSPGGGTSNALPLTVVAPAPVPTLYSLSPESVTAGGVAFTLIVHGYDFVPNSVVYWSGAALATTSVSNTVGSEVIGLTAQVPASDIASAGTANITVVTPPPGGGTSNSVPLTIVAPNPIPMLTSISPASATSGNGPLTLTLTGTGFLPSSAVAFAGTALAVTGQTASQITATVPASLLATVGADTVTVTNPAPGGGTSGPQNFIITQAPTTTALASAPNPSMVGQAVTLTATITGGSSPTGTIQFENSGTALGSPVTLSGGNATLTTSALPIGADSLTAVYSGDANNVGSTSVALTQTVTAGTPTANGQSGVSIPVNTAKAITLSGSDPDVPALPLTYTVVTSPMHGTLTGTAPSVTYTPTTGFDGPDGFTFTVSNGTNTSAPANVSLTVNLAPQPPVTLYALSYQGTYYFVTASQSQEAGLVANGWTGGPTGLVYANATDAPGLTPLYRVFSPATNDRFYTTSPSQRAALLAAGWQDQGVCCYVYPAPAAGAVPLYKAYNFQSALHQFTGDPGQYAALLPPWGQYGAAAYILPLPPAPPVPLYALSYQNTYYFLTANPSQESGLLAKGWAGGVTGHVYANPYDAPGLTALYQLFAPVSQDHFYTTSAPQLASLVGGGYQYKGVTGYVYPTQVSGTVPLYKAYDGQTGQHQFTGNAAQYNALSSPWGKYGPAADILP